MSFLRGPYRGRTGDLHNAIVALSQTELTAQLKFNIENVVRKYKVVVDARAISFYIVLMSRSTFLPAALAVFAALVVASCNENPPGPDDGSSVVFPDSGVSYSQHVEVLFVQRCAFSGCHAGVNPQGGLDLTPPSYAALRGHQPVLVLAGDANSSALIQFLDGRLQPQMPFNMSPLNSNQLNGIKTWISEGAINN